MLRLHFFFPFSFLVSTLAYIKNCSLMSLKSSPDMQMDVKDMSFFPDDSFESVIDKGKWMSSLKYAIQISEFVVSFHVLRLNL